MNKLYLYLLSVACLIISSLTAQVNDNGRPDNLNSTKANLISKLALPGSKKPELVSSVSSFLTEKKILWALRKLIRLTI